MVVMNIKKEDEKDRKKRECIRVHWQYIRFLVYLVMPKAIPSVNSY